MNYKEQRRERKSNLINIGVLIIIYSALFNILNQVEINSTEISKEEFRLGGFQGEISNVKFIEPKEPTSIKFLSEFISGSNSTQDINIKKIVGGSINYFVHNVRKEFDYEARFGMSPLNFPPAPLGHDPVSLADTDLRDDLAFIYIRDICGGEDGLDAQNGLRKRIMSYIRDDGFCWAPPYMIADLGPEPAILTWGTCKTIESLIETYVRTGSTEAKDQAKKSVDALRSLASWRDSGAWYKGGGSPWRNGVWLGPLSTYYPVILSHLVRFWEVTGDIDTLFFAIAFADGIIEGLQKNLEDPFLKDGSFWGHTHSHTYVLRGISQLGALLHNPRYIEYAKRGYDFVLSQGTDYGWFPEAIGLLHSETCVTGDMTQIASWLAKGGYPEYWDHVERFIRNYITKAQFFITPEYEALYRKLNGDKADEGLAIAKELEGGFVAAFAPNDWTMRPNFMNMMGCCPPSAIMAIYIGWKNIVTESPEGVFINLSFNTDKPQAKVISFLPTKGQLTVLVKDKGNKNFFLRPPAWAPREKVKSYRNGKLVDITWGRMERLCEV